MVQYEAIEDAGIKGTAHGIANVDAPDLTRNEACGFHQTKACSFYGPFFIHRFSSTAVGDCSINI